MQGGKCASLTMKKMHKMVKKMHIFGKNGQKCAKSEKMRKIHENAKITPKM